MPETAKPRTLTPQVLAWAFYDWANSAFATTVMAGFFPIFYIKYFRAGNDALAKNEFFIGTVVAGVCVAVLAPILGAIADRGGAKKRLLAAFAFLGVLATGMLAFLGQEAGALAMGVFVLGNIGFSGANVFYDSLLVAVTPEGKSDFVSAFGYSAGYLGGGILFLLNVVMYMKPEVFGLADGSAAIKASFATVALWWAVFSIPLFLKVQEPAVPSGRVPLGQAVSQGWRQLVHTFHELRRLRMVFLFLIAYLLYIDGVNTVMRSATAIGTLLGFEAATMMTALLIVQFVGFPAAIAFGKIGEKIGTRSGILIGLTIYGLGVVAASQMREEWHFFALAMGVALVQGGVQALSRSYFSRLIPAGKAGEFFGFYNMLGKFAVVFGPLLLVLGGTIGAAALGLDEVGALRFSLPFLIVLFALGGWLLSRVRESEAPQA